MLTVQLALAVLVAVLLAVLPTLELGVPEVQAEPGALVAHEWKEAT